MGIREDQFIARAPDRRLDSASQIVESREDEMHSNINMSVKTKNGSRSELLLHQNANAIQKFGTVRTRVPIGVDEDVRKASVEKLNQVLVDTITLRDLYKKHHWQVSGPTFYQLHLLFDKHYGEQNELVDVIAERVQLLGGISIAMAPDVAETTRIERPPRGREEVPVQISRLLDAHQIIIEHCRKLASRASDLEDAGTNDMVVSQVLRTNELQVWFLSEHLVEMPLVHAQEPGMRKVG